MLPTIAVTIPMSEDHSRSVESPSLSCAASKMPFHRGDASAARFVSALAGMPIGVILVEVLGYSEYPMILYK